MKGVAEAAPSYRAAAEDKYPRLASKGRYRSGVTFSPEWSESRRQLRSYVTGNNAVREGRKSRQESGILRTCEVGGRVNHSCHSVHSGS